MLLRQTENPVGRKKTSSDSLPDNQTPRHRSLSLSLAALCK